jgi:peptidoglycan/xylan/chitin deacetylase (PgdA/CDA1 family)
MRGNLDRISWDLGPTLGSWLAAADPAAHRAFAAAAAGGNAMAQAFHHSILPLASAADRRTEIRWGLREFEIRFGRRPGGLWLPETAVDLPTLRIAAEEGVRYTILAPWQATEPAIDTRRLYQVEVGDGRSVVVVFYDAGLSTSVSFEPEATSDADRFARDRVAARLGGGDAPGGQPPLALIASDGELYGHHQQFRDLFLQRLVSPEPGSADRGFDVVQLADVIAEESGQPYPVIRVADRTSWSCHHGVLRWYAECADAADGRWKGPLRAAFERLAAGVDLATEVALGALPGAPDPWVLRDAWVDVVVGATTVDAFVAEHAPSVRSEEDRGRIANLLEAQRWRLAMFASDGWYWDDPVRPETRQVLRAAARAARIVDEATGSSLERRLVADLSLFVSPSRGIDGAAIYRMALDDVGQAALAELRS